jgi:hypothetical protein
MNIIIMLGSFFVSQKVKKICALQIVTTPSVAHPLGIGVLYLGMKAIEG